MQFTWIRKDRIPGNKCPQISQIFQFLQVYETFFSGEKPISSKYLTLVFLIYLRLFSKIGLILWQITCFVCLDYYSLLMY